jgi:dTDP-4-dehydrorhamnose reductase
VRVVVFGFTGMVGRGVAARFRTSSDVELLTVSRANHQFDAGADPDVRGLLRGAGLAINCIGILRSTPSYGTPAYQYAATMVNGVWPQKLAIQASEVGCRVIHVSTDAVFSPGIDPAAERTPIGPPEPYGISKALGEVDANNVINLRASVIGPAPGRNTSLWEWLVCQPRDAIVHGYASFVWTGCTSAQLACLIADLAAPNSFELVRSAGPVHHFVPNGAVTKFEVLHMLAERLRPDLSVVPVPEARPSARPLASSLGACDRAYTGPWGWSGALEA